MKILFVFVLNLLLSSVVIAGQTNKSYQALSYHDVTGKFEADHDSDRLSVDALNLAAHFEWLRENGYSVVSIKDIEQARAGKKPLPDKPILLTFDDGYLSFYQHVYPLLKQYSYPAVLAVVTSWLDVPAGSLVAYGDTLKKRSKFLQWELIKEMQASGLVEVASHTHDLHKGVIANPQGNSLAAIVTRKFNAITGYEDDAAYKYRVEQDLRTSYNIIKTQTGKAPTSLVWPYGRYNEVAWDIAKLVGFTHSFTLEDYSNNLDTVHIGRKLVVGNPKISTFQVMLSPQKKAKAQRIVHVDLDYVYDKDLVQQERNIGQLVRRIASLKVSDVYLQAFSDIDGDGNAESLYFPNQYLPMRADLFNRVAWQLETRAKVNVYAWMPVSAFDISDELYKEQGVYSFESGKAELNLKAKYKRLSIFVPSVQTKVKAIYQDLAKYAVFSGVLFHDDAYLNDFEDVRPEALSYYRSKGLVFVDVNQLNSDRQLHAKWARLKTEALIDFTLQLADVVRAYRPNIKTARNLYALPVLNKESESWFAQELTLFTKAYDSTVIMAMPQMEKAENNKTWIERLVAAVVASGVTIDKVVMELQSVDWRYNNKPIPEHELLDYMRIFRLHNFNYGYYPDNYIKNQPDIDLISPAMSLPQTKIKEN